MKTIEKPVDRAANRPFLLALKVLILLSPVPFGCVGKFFSPLFYLLLLGVCLLGFKAKTPARDSASLKWLRRFFYGLLGFFVLQVVPLPLSWLEVLSPTAVRVLGVLKDQPPGFHPLSLVPFETLLFGLKFLVLGIFFGVLVRMNLRRRDMVSLLDTLVLSALLQALLGLVKYLMGNRFFFLFFYPQERDVYSNFLTGTLGNPDHSAFFFEMVIPLALALLFLRARYFEERHSWRGRLLLIFDLGNKILFYFTAVVSAAVGIILSGSRSGVVTLVLSLLIFGQISFYLGRDAGFRRRVKWFFIVFTCLALYLGVSNMIQKFKISPLAEAGRLVRWPDTLSMVSDFPLLGTGFGTYRYAFYLYDTVGGRWSTHAHNDYLEVLAEGGAVGGLLFFSMAALAVYGIIGAWRHRRRSELKMLGLGALVGLFAAAFHSFFDFSLRIPSNLFALVLILALGFQVVNYKKR